MKTEEEKAQRINCVNVTHNVITLALYGKRIQQNYEIVSKHKWRVI